MILMACTQTTFAQKVVLHLSNQQKTEYSLLQVDSITFKEVPTGSDIIIINDLWDVIQYYSAFYKMKEYIEEQKPGILFYNKDYLPQKGGQNWDMALKCFNAQINEGDSAYTIMALNFEAWDKAKRKLAPLYRYANKYEDRVEGEKYGFPNTRTIEDPDSLANLSIGMDMTCPLIFNRNEQPEDKSYMVSTHGDTLRGDAAAWIMDIPHHTPSCGANKGYCYEVRNWAMPKEWYFPDVEVEVDDEAFYGKESFTHYLVGEDSRKIDFDINKFSDIADKYGRVGRNDFYWLAPIVTRTPNVEIKLTNNVMSGKYDIYAVMVPWWYTRLDEEGFADSIRNKPAFADSISASTKMCFTAQLHYNNNATNGKDVTSKKTPVIEYDGTKVDTIKIFEDFEFPYSYKNLRYSYPTLQISGATKGSGSGETSVKKGFKFGLCIDRLILKSKEE